MDHYFLLRALEDFLSQITNEALRGIEKA